MAERVGNGIHAQIPEAAQGFLSDQTFIVLGAEDGTGQIWASLLQGPRGFLEVTAPAELTINALPSVTDPLFARLTTTNGLSVGILAIEPATRRRMRLNGQAVLIGDRLIVHAREVYANCPKYIQKREIDILPVPVPVETCQVGKHLTVDQAAAIRRADTFFIATRYPDHGADASHRGGNPGFVRVSEDGAMLYWPDYAGNAMFNTLGNIAVHPAAGLLFVDFEGNGSTLQLTGQASILWDQEAERLTGTARGVSFTVESVLQRTGTFPMHSHLLEYSKFNPRV
jgi:predicted pyridoxine 5'-phosphate oxidase superfamily flavin-nucleotide-binding protein